MRYELDLVHEKCRQVGLNSAYDGPDTLSVSLSAGAKLRFKNKINTYTKNGLSKDGDALIDMGDEVPWHTHAHELEFTNPSGEYVKLDYIDLIDAIAFGDILIAKLWTSTELKDRWLIHKDYNDDFDFLERDQEVRVRRAAFPGFKA